MTDIVNLTPHPITLRYPDGKEVVIHSSGNARVDSEPGDPIASNGAGFPLEKAPAWGNIYGLWEPKPNTIYVVSLLVLESLRRQGIACTRPDVFGPGTGPKDGAIRNSQGQVIAVTKLIQA